MEESTRTLIGIFRTIEDAEKLKFKKIELNEKFGEVEFVMWAVEMDKEIEYLI